MKTHSLSRPERGFTFIELLISASISGAVAIAIFSFLQTGMFLAAKNLSVNLSSNHLRGALDRVEMALTQGDGAPVLIDTAGATVATGPAAGVKFDRYIGGPYVITSPALPLPAGAANLTLTRSSHLATAAPIPRIGDLIRIDSTVATLRPRITAASPGTIDTVLSRQPVSVALNAPLGTSVSPGISTILTAKLIRPVAFIVMPVGARHELRYYDSFDTTTNFNDPTKYALVTDQISPVAGDITPFSISTVTYSGTEKRTFVNIGIRIRASNFDRRLLGKQNDEFNNFTRVDALIRPKMTP